MNTLKKINKVKVADLVYYMDATSRLISALSDIKDITSSQERLGAWVYILDTKNGKFAHFGIGIIFDEEKSERYKKLSKEKALRLKKMFKKMSHTNSGMSTNTELEHFQGAVIFADRYIFSTSGWNSDGDVLNGLLGAEFCALIDSAISKEAEELVAYGSHTKNIFIERLKKRLAV